MLENKTGHVLNLIKFTHFHRSYTKIEGILAQYETTKFEKKNSDITGAVTVLNKEDFKIDIVASSTSGFHVDFAS